MVNPLIGGSHPVTVHVTLSLNGYLTLDSLCSFPKEYTALVFGIQAAVEAPQTANLDRGASYVDTRSGLQGRVAGAAPGHQTISELPGLPPGRGLKATLP